MDERTIQLDPLVNKLVRFKLHESSQIYEAIILAFDETGYWVRGGSLCEYLKNADSDHGSDSDTRYLDVKRIHWIQHVTG
jgi:hypothetical protein